MKEVKSTEQVIYDNVNMSFLKLFNVLHHQRLKVTLDVFHNEENAFGALDSTLVI